MSRCLIRNETKALPEPISIPFFFSFYDLSPDTTIPAAKPPAHLHWLSVGDVTSLGKSLTPGPPRLLFSTKSGETVIETVHTSVRY